MSEKALGSQGLSVLWQLIKDKIANLADNESTIYLTEDEHLTLKGYTDATQGQMLVKDTDEGLTWVNPLSDEKLNQAVADATAQANAAGSSAITAGNAAVDASQSAAAAERINQQTMNWVNNKFWWGTLEEYNALTEITEGTFYFVQL